MTKEQAAYVFLQNLRDNRALQQKLFSLAEDQPQAVLEYIDTLPDDWRRTEDSTTDLLKRLEHAANNQLNRK